MDFGKTAEELKKLFSVEGAFRIVSHIDADGISSAAIIVKLLKQNDQTFWLSTVKQLEENIIDKIEKELSKHNYKAVMFLDLGAGNINRIAKLASYAKVFILDHHLLDQDISQFKKIENLYLLHSTELCASCICYYLAKALGASKEFAQLAVIGLIGDVQKVSKFNIPIINEAQESGMKIQKSLAFFSATRPLHKSLEFGSEIYIPGVTGNSLGAIRMLREAGIELKKGKAKGWRSIMDLNEEELSRLITSIMIRIGSNNEIISNVYLIKIAEMLWDGKELSTMLNACGRLGKSSLGIAFLLGSKEAREELDSVYLEYRHHLIKALNYVESLKKIQGRNYVVVDAKAAIKDTMIGTIMSILSNSFIYPAGTIIIGMAYRDDGKIKISARIAKGNSNNRNDSSTEVNLNELLVSVVKVVGGEVGGHPSAAGALILKEKKDDFLDMLQRELSMLEIKVKVS